AHLESVQQRVQSGLARGEGRDRGAGNSESPRRPAGVRLCAWRRPRSILRQSRSGGLSPFSPRIRAPAMTLPPPGGLTGGAVASKDPARWPQSSSQIGGPEMPEHKIGTREEWQAARNELAELEAQQAEREQEI